MPPESLTVIQGNDGVFVCQADGVPRPVITWVYYSPLTNITTDIRTNTDYSIDVDDTQPRLVTSTLTVLRTEVADFGVYSCIATNIVGSTENRSSLFIHGELNIESFHIKICIINKLWLEVQVP